MQSIVSQSPRAPIVLMVPMLYQSPSISFCEQKKSHFPYTMVQSKSCSSEKAQWGHRKGTRMSRVNRSPDSGDVVPQWDIPRTWGKPLLWLHWLRPRCLSVRLTLLPYFSCPSWRLYVLGTFNFFGLSLWFGPHFPSLMHGPWRLFVGNPQSFPRGLTFLRNLVEVSISL